jgi:hypothetical protein
MDESDNQDLVGSNSHNRKNLSLSDEGVWQDSDIIVDKFTGRRKLFVIRPFTL